MNPEAKFASGLRIREAALVDAGKISALLQEASVAARWSHSQLCDMLAPEPQAANPSRLLFVLEEAGETLGFLAGHVLAPESDLENIVVDPRSRRRGFGTILLHEFLRQAEKRGARVAFLEVRESNLAARALYERTGFRETGRRNRYYREPEEDAILYRRSLGTRERDES
jgi:ribosomal-protein-alanine N-acetyltransferase